MTDRGATEVIAYHFTSDTLRDGRPIPAIGEKLEYDGHVIICEAGLHASEHPFDALYYAPGPMLHRVVMRDVVDRQDDKLVARERTILATIDATALLREFARWCALQVIDHWDAPAVVREYLETGDEALRAEARSATPAAIAVGTAVETAWEVVVLDAAASARSAARSAARDAAAMAAWTAAYEAASSASSAAYSAAYEATASQPSAAWLVTYTRDAQRKRFAEMVAAAFDKEGKSNE